MPFDDMPHYNNHTAEQMGDALLAARKVEDLYVEETPWINSAAQSSPSCKPRRLELLTKHMEDNDDSKAVDTLELLANTVEKAETEIDA
jgi:hypothetical protein